MRSRAVVVGIALGVLAGALGFAAPAGAQDPVYPPSTQCGVQLSASAVRADQSFTVTGTQADPAELVTILAFVRREFATDPVVLGTATTDARGAFTLDAKLPADAKPGVGTIRVLGRTSCDCEVNVVEDAALAVAASRGSGSGSALAFTGANPLTLVLVALVTLTVGFVLVAGERRHRVRRSTIRRERRERRHRMPVG
jgi:hypothetical protein